MSGAMMVPHPKPATPRPRSRCPDGITSGQSRSDLRWAAPRGPVKFALDSPLEGAVHCELVSEVKIPAPVTKLGADSGRVMG